MTQSAGKRCYRPLPNGWRWAKLRELCTDNVEAVDPTREPEKEFSYVDISSVDNVEKRITAPKSLLGRDAPSRARQRIRAGDLLVATTRPNLNAVAMVPRELDGQVCSTGFCVLRPGNPTLGRLIFAFVQSPLFVDRFLTLVQGALYPAINDDDVKDSLIPFPAFPPEQAAIAARLEAQMAEVARMRRAAECQREALDHTLQSMVRALFSSTVVDEWPRVVLGEVSKVRLGRQRSPDNRPLHHATKYVRAANVDHDRLLLDDIMEMDFTPAERERYELKAGDLLVVEGSGSRSEVGKCAIWQGEIPDCCFQNTLVRVRCDSETLWPRFVFHALSHARWEGTFAAMAEATNIVHLGATRLAAHRIPVPDIELQRSFAAELDTALQQCSHVSDASARQLEAIEALPGALLREVFGESEPTS